MKIFKKNIALIMLFVMIGNFFIAPICDVYAESSSEVETYITMIDEKVNSINEAISIAKLGTDYISDNAYIYAVNRLESEAGSTIENFNIKKLVLGNTVSLEKLLTDSNSSYIDDYNNYFTSDIILTLSNIEDIEYSTGELNKVISGEELASLVKSTYFKDYFNKLNDLSNNYGTYIENYKNLYNENSNISNSIDNIQENNKKVRSIPKLLLGESGTTLSDLISEIESLTDEYKNFKTEITNLYTSNGMDYNNPDYTIVNTFDNSKIDSFVSAYEKGIGLDDKYQLLLETINEYLKENQETEELSIAINDLKNYHSESSKDTMMKHYSNIVYNSNVTLEDIVDTLLGFASLDNQSEEYKYLTNAKYSFYQVSLKDESTYTSEISGDYLIVKGSSNIEKVAFNDNIKYRDNCNFELKGENSIIDSTFTLDLYDKDNALLRTLNLVIKNDINDDGIVDEEDVESLKNKLLTEDFTEPEKLTNDINDDGIINIADLVALDTIVDEKETQGNTTEALFDVVITEKANSIVYDVYLKTNGIVRGFEFILNNSDNLKIISVIPAEGVLFQNNNSNIKTIGLGEYTNNTLLITVVYEKLNNNISSKLTIDNGILTFDNNNSVINEQILNNFPGVIPEKQVEEVQDEIFATQTVNTVNENNETTNENNSTNFSIEPRTVTDDNTKRESIITGEELDEEEIIWGNIIKIALIVLLGALVIYFLNKDTEEENKEFLKEEDENKTKENNQIKEDKEKMTQEENKDKKEIKENKTNKNHNNNNKDSKNNNHTKKKKHKKNRSR